MEKVNIPFLKNKSILDKRLSGQILSYFSIIMYWGDQKVSYFLAFELYIGEIHFSVKIYSD